MTIITNRKIGKLGRIVLPLEVRTNLNLNEGDSLAICLEGNKVVLLPNQNSCALCRATEDLIEIHGRYICSDCKAKVTSAG